MWDLILVVGSGIGSVIFNIVEYNDELSKLLEHEGLSYPFGCSVIRTDRNHIATDYC